MSHYKIVIADDEHRIRKGLVNSIPWEELGFEVVADFMDGSDVIEYLKHHEANVVFADVQMCQISGLEVANWISKNKQNIKVVLISGYKEFAYVKEAIQIGVVDYILKPLNILEIKKVFQKVKKELDQEKEWFGENMTTLLDFQEDVNCCMVLKEEKALIEAVIGANNVQFIKCSRQWQTALQSAKIEYVPLLILNILNALYQRIEEVGIRLDEKLQKERILGRIRIVSKDILKDEVKLILQEIFEGIQYKKSTEKENMVSKAAKYIDEHMAEDFGVGELAEYVNLSQSYFSREFKRITGETVVDYILSKRMERAILLINEGKYSTERIADSVGYTDIKYFQRVFKKYTGYTVREYRNLVR